MKPAVLCCRVSSRKQEKGYSLDSQKKYGKEYADKNDLRIVKTFHFSETASKSTIRKTFKEMTAYISRKNIGNLIIEKTDRLTRNLFDFVMVEDMDITVHYFRSGWVVNKEADPSIRKAAAYEAVDAWYYSLNLSKEIKR